MTVAEYAPEWLASLQVADSTKAMYRSIVRHQLGGLAAIRLTRLAPPDIRRLLAEREREGYAGRTRRAILDVLRMMLRLAESDGLVERNVAQLVDPPAIDAKEPVHFTAEQARRFLEVCREDPLYSLYAVAIGTGLRRGETLSLTWRDVVLGDRGRPVAVRVRAAKTAAGVRVVPVPAFAAEALECLEARPGRIWPYSPSHVTRHVAVICARAGLPRVTFHSLRHSTASILLHEGVPIEVIRSLLGHTNAKMTQLYARPEEDRKREAMEKLGRAVG